MSSKNNDDNSIKEEKKKPENVIEPENLTLRERIEQKYKCNNFNNNFYLINYYFILKKNIILVMKEKPGNETINE